MPISERNAAYPRLIFVPLVSSALVKVRPLTKDRVHVFRMNHERCWMVHPSPPFHVALSPVRGGADEHVTPRDAMSAFASLAIVCSMPFRRLTLPFRLSHNATEAGELDLGVIVDFQ